MSEIWKPIKGYEENYMVSNFGRIKRTSKARGTNDGYIFCPSKDQKGYYRTRLTNKNGKAKTVKVHRIVCEAFHSNPQNLPQVNHRDTIKTNNFADNLEWCTNLFNKKHATKNGLIPRGWLGKFGKNHNKSIPIKVININTGIEQIIIGINEAARKLKINSSSIWRVLRGEWNQIKGYKFERL